ncbi:hypothetical protein SDC9_108896 [bioreactor metagenome]|uniref:Uncharacterized protein n=1 Tax=bioreactor metagenome TaxID=1076179 RepID=A0A645BBJ3_9ZZZZ
MQAGDERLVAAGGHRLERGRPHPGHDPHRHRHVGGVGDLHAELRVLGVDRAHAERDDVHRPAVHRAAVELGQGGLHLGRVAPVVRRAGVDLLLRADERTVLDPGHVVGVGGEVVGVLLLVVRQADGRAGGDELGAESVVLLLGPVTPIDGIGFGECCDLGDPLQKSLVGRGCLGGVNGHGVLLVELEPAGTRTDASGDWTDSRPLTQLV